MSDAGGAAAVPQVDDAAAEALDGALASASSTLLMNHDAAAAAIEALDAPAAAAADAAATLTASTAAADGVDVVDVETVPLTRGAEPAPPPACSPAPPPAVDPLDAHFVAHLQRDPLLLLHRTVYFLGMGANSAYYPFAVQLWAQQGLDMQQAGVVYACGHVSAMLSAPLLSALADRGPAWRRGVLVGGCVAQGAAILAMSRARSFVAIAATQAVIEGVSSVVWTSMDSATQRLLLVTKGSTSEYGNTRAWGAVGWGALALVFGAIFDAHGLRSGFVLYCVVAAPAALLAALVPLERRASTSAGRAAALRALARPDVLVVLGVVVVTAILLQIVDIYRFSFLSSVGASNALLGGSLLVTAVSEAPFFFVTAPILERISTRAALLCVLAGYALRFVYYSLIGEAPLVSPWWTMPAELLHGFTFALGWAASTQYVAALMPPELSSSAQGLLAAIHWGLGSAAGSVGGGAVAREWGWRVMWRAFAALAAGTWLLLAALGARGGGGGGGRVALAGVVGWVCGARARDVS